MDSVNLSNLLQCVHKAMGTDFNMDIKTDRNFDGNVLASTLLSLPLPPQHLLASEFIPSGYGKCTRKEHDSLDCI